MAVRYMTPVVLLSDGYLANGAEPWKFPKLEDLAPIDIQRPTSPGNGNEWHCYGRNDDLARPWAIPGMAGFEHRIGGLEKQDITGNVSYDPANHEHMIRTRAEKVRRAQLAHDPLLWHGDDQGDLLVVGWGSTYGSILAAVGRARKVGKSVSACHLRSLSPMPEGLGDRLKKFPRVLVPEMNMGQLCMLLRARYLVDARPLTKVQGQPFTISEIQDGINDALEEN
jgi:2-oxoglutarate ferredoxin oxidoreductase subunit alpha